MALIEGAVMTESVPADERILTVPVAVAVAVPGALSLITTLAAVPAARGAE